MIELNAINKHMALIYMGYKEAEASSEIRDIVSECEAALLKIVRPRVVCRCFGITDPVDDDGIKLNNCTLELKGAAIAAHLKNCEKAVLMAATLSLDVDRLIKKTQVEDMVRALAFDCLASQAIEQVCDLAEAEIKKDYPGFYLTSRFSPGYVDLPIETQGEFLTVLNAQRRIGLCVTRSNMLTPAKSVTAVIGLSTTPTNKIKNCDGCGMKYSCGYKKRGADCGL